jgi:hypothetical protein
MFSTNQGSLVGAPELFYFLLQNRFMLARKIHLPTEELLLARLAFVFLLYTRLTGHSSHSW